MLEYKNGDKALLNASCYKYEIHIYQPSIVYIKNINDFTKEKKSVSET